MSIKTVLVIGASGFVGSNLVQGLKDKYKVIAAFRDKVIPYAGVTHIMYSLQDRDYMKRVFMIFKPDVVIYAAGISDLVECALNPQLADLVNNFGPIAISSAGDTIPHRLINLSTAFVYDGKKGNFLETDVTFPETQLGTSKLSGENFIKSKTSIYTIFRLSPLIGVGSPIHPSFIDKLRMKLQKGERVELPENEFHSFLSIDILIKAIDWVILNETKNAIYNLGGLTKLSWYEFGKVLADKLGFNSNLIVNGKGNFESSVDFTLNSSEFIKQSEIDTLILEESLDLFKNKLIL